MINFKKVNISRSHKGDTSLRVKKNKKPVQVVPNLSKLDDPPYQSLVKPPPLIFMSSIKVSASYLGNSPKIGWTIQTDDTQ